MEETKMQTQRETNLVKKVPEFFWNVLTDESGRIGYLIAWLFGVPASVLFVIFLIRGH